MQVSATFVGEWWEDLCGDVDYVYRMDPENRHLILFLHCVTKGRKVDVTEYIAKKRPLPERKKDGKGGFYDDKT